MNNIKEKEIKKISGFTIIEVIIVMTAIAVISSISYPSFVRLFDKQTMEAEKRVMTEIKKAMEVYAEREGKLPYLETGEGNYLCDKDKANDEDMWNVQLSWYSNLTPNEICFNQYGKPRIYHVNKIKEMFGNYDYYTYYASVTSLSEDQFKEKAKDKTYGEWSSMDDLDVLRKDAEESEEIFLTAHSDNKNKLTLYKETLKRIEKIEKYLERYARSKRAIALFYDEKDFDNFIFYPDDGSSSGSYYTPKNDDGKSLQGVDKLKKTRDATSLAKILGLPEYYGIDAVTGQEMLYVSNPGKDLEEPCKHPNSKAPYYPPRIIPLKSSVLKTGNKLGC